MPADVTRLSVFHVLAGVGTLVVDDTALGFSPTAEDLGLTVVVHEPGGAAFPVAADPDRLAQVVANLVENALNHTPARSTVSLALAKAVTGFTLGMTITMPVAGRLSDQFGRRRIFIVAAKFGPAPAGGRGRGPVLPGSFALMVVEHQAAE